jgi:ubiquinone/menaquinone biosynthesis C-methylase UbiE
MIRRAGELNADIGNCEFRVNREADLNCFDDSTFDMVYSFIVLQHVPGRWRIERYIEEFVRVLRPRGLLVFQLPSAIPWRHRIQPRRRCIRFFERLAYLNGFCIDGSASIRSG